MTIYRAWFKPAACILLVLAALGVYGQVWHHDFVSFDDARYILNNPVVNQGITLEGLRWAISFSDIDYWHPLTWISHMLDWTLFGSNPGPPHLINLLLHLANTGLLGFLLFRLTGAFWRSFLVAALFALHPMNVESVAWLSERKNLLSTLFGLAALVSYAAYARGARRGAYSLALALFVLGLMAKPSLVTLPALLLLLDYWPLQRLRARPLQRMGLEGFKLLVEKLPFFFLAGTVVLLASYSTHRRGIDISLEALPLGLRLENAGVSVVDYIGRFFWPAGLSVFYPFPETIPMLRLGLALVVLVAVSFLAVVYRRRLPYLMVGWGWFLVALAPMLGLKQAGLWPAMADRWAYVPYMGFMIAGVWGVGALVARQRLKAHTLAVACTAILMILSALTYVQAGYWKNSQTLFQRAVNVDPDNDVAHNNLGAALYTQGYFQQSVYHFLEALRVQPGYQAAHDNLDAGLTQLGYGNNLPEGVAQLMQARPRMPALYFHQGDLMARLGDLPSAESFFTQALELKPDYLQALNALCRALMIQGKYDKALAWLKTRAAMAPVNAAVYYDLARIYAQRGDADQCRQWLARAIEEGFADWTKLASDPLFEKVKQTAYFKTLPKG